MSVGARLASVDGMGPDSWLELSARVSSAVALPREAGMGPVSALLLMSSSARLRHRHRSSGMAPVRLASETTKDTRPGSAAQRPDGTGTARCTDWKDMDVTPAPEQEMCDQLQGDKEAGDQSGGRAAVVLSQAVRKATSEEEAAAEEGEVAARRRRWSKRRGRGRRWRRRMGLGDGNGNGSSMKNCAVFGARAVHNVPSSWACLLLPCWEWR